MCVFGGQAGGCLCEMEEWWDAWHKQGRVVGSWWQGLTPTTRLDAVTDSSLRVCRQPSLLRPAEKVSIPIGTGLWMFFFFYSCRSSTWRLDAHFFVLNHISQVEMQLSHKHNKPQKASIICNMWQFIRICQADDYGHWMFNFGTLWSVENCHPQQTNCSVFKFSSPLISSPQVSNLPIQIRHSQYPVACRGKILLPLMIRNCK